MSDAFIVRRGGGGGLSKCSIIVHIDSGSTVAAYSNSAATTLVKTGKEIGTSGDYLITGLDTGTYYVKATKGTDEAISAPVTFSEYAIADIVLTYSISVYDYGAQDTSLTGGLVFLSGVENDFTFNTDNISIYISQNLNGRSTTYKTANNLDLTGFSTINVRAAVATAEKSVHLRVGVYKASDGSTLAEYDTNTITSEATRTVDISGVGSALSDCYIAVKASVYSGDNNPSIISATVFQILVV